MFLLNAATFLKGGEGEGEEERRPAKRQRTVTKFPFFEGLPDDVIRDHIMVQYSDKETAMALGRTDRRNRDKFQSVPDLPGLVEKVPWEEMAIDTKKTICLALQGSLLVSGTSDKRVRVWDVETGRFLRSLRGHSGKVTSVAIDGDRIVSGSVDEDDVYVWNIAGKDPSKWGLVTSLESHYGGVKSVAISGNRVASAGDQRVILWDLDTEEEERELEGPTDYVTEVAMDGSRVVAGDDHGYVYVWNAETGDLAHSFTSVVPASAWSSINAVAIEGSRVVVGAHEGIVKVWDVSGDKARLVVSFEHRSGKYLRWVTSVAIHGSRVVSGSGDRTVKVWDITEGASRLLYTSDGHAGDSTVHSVAMDQSRVVSGSPQRIIVHNQWTLRTFPRTSAKSAQESSSEDDSESSSSDPESSDPESSDPESE